MSQILSAYSFEKDLKVTSTTTAWSATTSISVYNFCTVHYGEAKQAWCLLKLALQWPDPLPDFWLPYSLTLIAQLHLRNSMPFSQFSATSTSTPFPLGHSHLGIPPWASVSASCPEGTYPSIFTRRDVHPFLARRFQGWKTGEGAPRPYLELTSGLAAQGSSR